MLPGGTKTVINQLGSTLLYKCSRASIIECPSRKIRASESLHIENVVTKLMRDLKLPIVMIRR